jgi:hypothetical protein
LESVAVPTATYLPVHDGFCSSRRSTSTRFVFTKIIDANASPASSSNCVWYRRA